MQPQHAGTLIIIGGREDKQQERSILQLVAQAARHVDGSMVVMTAATAYPVELAEQYVAIFTALGVKQIDVVHCETRDQANNEEHLETLRRAAVVFFTGGDQLRLTSQLGGSLACDCLQELYACGGTLAGTSAGAVAMAATMLVGSGGDKSKQLLTLEMVPGLGFLADVVIDSHFAERGRIGRLLGAVAQNPRNLGLGIDEDTAVVVQADTFHVVGAGAVYVIDGSDISFSSLTDARPEGSIVSIYDVRLHILAHGDKYDFKQRRPMRPSEPAGPAGWLVTGNA